MASCVAALLAGAILHVHAAPASLESTLTLPAKPPAPGESFAILATGDGGWAELDRELVLISWLPGRLCAAGAR